VKRCVAYDGRLQSPRGRPHEEVVESDLKCLYLDKSDVTDHKKWRKLVRVRQVSDDESSNSM